MIPRSCAILPCWTGRRWNLCCSMRSSLPPTGMIPVVAGRRRTRRGGWYSSPATSSATIASPDLAWWQLQHAVPRTRGRVVLGPGSWPGSRPGSWPGSRFGLEVPGPGRGWGRWGRGRGWGCGRARGRGRARSSRTWYANKCSGGSWSGSWPGSWPVLVVCGLVFGVGGGVVNGVVVGVGVGLVVGVGFAAEGVPGDLAEATSPRTVLARDRRTALLLMLAAGVVFGVVIGLVVGGPGAVGVGVGIAAGLGAGIGLSVRRAAWPSYVLTSGGWRCAAGCRGR